MAGTGGKRPGAGRPKGSNLAKSVREFLEANKCKPEEILMNIAMGNPMKARLPVAGSDDDFVVQEVEPTLDQRQAAAKELLQYCAPKLKAVDHSGSVEVSWSEVIASAWQRSAE